MLKTLQKVSIPKGAIMRRRQIYSVRHKRVSIPKGAIMRIQLCKTLKNFQCFNSKRCDYERANAIGNKQYHYVSIPKGAIMSYLQTNCIQKRNVSIPKGAIMSMVNAKKLSQNTCFNSKRCDYEHPRGTSSRV